MLCIGAGPSFCCDSEFLSGSKQISSTCNDALEGSTLDIWSDIESLFSALSFSGNNSFNKNKELTIFAAIIKT